MPNAFGAPEISVHEVSQKLNEAGDFILMDVRELWETSLARIKDERVLLVPMSELAHEGTNALPKEAQDRQAEIIVVCHHGVRSAEVTAWLASQGWENVRSMAGGLEAFAVEVDPSIGRY